jgi:circadian clock protein KaiC
MKHEKVTIRRLSTGVEGLDDVLGGGIPELSLNLLVGGVGAGKTTLGHQIMFANASPERKALFFTIIGEPPVKMLRYMQQLTFFDADKLESCIRFVHLGDDAREGGLARVLQRIIDEVDQASPALVFVDSVRSILHGPQTGELSVRDFTQALAIHLTSCETTSFLLGEYRDDESDSSVFTVADGIVRLTQATDRNSVVRKLQVQKMRGQGQIPGLHTMRITENGVRVFPRILKPAEDTTTLRSLEDRLSTGTPALDDMLGGGIPRANSVLVSGPSGSGKTILAIDFLLEGARRGEPGVIALFEKRPSDFLQTTPHREALEVLIAANKIALVSLRPLDLSIDETLTTIRDAVGRIGAKRAVIDSLSGLELALAPTFREDFRESLFRMIGTLTGMGVTVLSTVELPDGYTSLQFSPHGIAFLCDTIIMQRYVAIAGQLQRLLSVVKVRGSAHSKQLRVYDIASNGALVLGEALAGYDGLLTGAATLAP